MEATMTSKAAKAPVTEVRVSPKEVEKQLNQVEELQKALKDAQNVLKLARDAEKAARNAAKAAKVKKGSFTRLTAAVMAFTANPSGDREALVLEAMAIYTEHTGKEANKAMLTHSYNNVKQCLAAGMTLPAEDTK